MIVIYRLGEVIISCPKAGRDYAFVPTGVRTSQEVFPDTKRERAGGGAQSPMTFGELRHSAETYAR